MVDVWTNDSYYRAESRPRSYCLLSKVNHSSAKLPGILYIDTKKRCWINTDALGEAEKLQSHGSVIGIKDLFLTRKVGRYNFEAFNFMSVRSSEAAGLRAGTQCLIR